MTSESAVEFATASRIHMGLAVKNLEQSIRFYSLLFGQEPSKVKHGYAKFEVAEPPVNLSLNVVTGETKPTNAVAHFGIQVKSTDTVLAVSDRLTQAGLKLRTEDQVTCCYAVQNKVWATDPDGNEWEIFVVLDNDGAHHHSSASECCSQLPVLNDLQTVEQEKITACCSPN